MAERWTQIRKLFREALELEPAQWEHFLRSNCPDEAMRDKVSAMLAAYEVDDTFLEHPAADVGPGAQDRNTATQLVGSHVGPYKIKRSIARGGMGVVFEALDTKLDKVVALKMMSPALVQDPSFRQRFEQEARTLARLEDPHFVRVNALIDDGPNTFIVMEYVDGITLANHIRKRGPLAGKDAIAVGLQLLQALSKAHRQGIVHRDLKPSNIMLTKNYEGRLLVKVLDFGIAKNILPDGNQTRTVGAVGTLFYMSPEQARGLRSIDHRTDLYSLGVTLYEAVSGALPFDVAADEYTVRRQIVEGHVVPINKRIPNVEPALANVLATALATDPDKRYDSAETMRQALIDALDEIRESRIDKPPSLAQKPLPPVETGQKKKPVMAVAGLSIFVVLAIASFYFYSQFTNAPAEPAATVASTLNGDTLQTDLEIDQLALSTLPDTSSNNMPESQTPSREPAATEDTSQPATRLPVNQPITEDEPNTGVLNNTPLEIDQQENEPIEVNPAVAIDSTSRDSASLQPGSGDAQTPVATGQLTIYIKPLGSVYVNDELRLANDLVHSEDLPAGNNMIRVENTTLGTWACNMEISPNRKQEITVDFGAPMALTVAAEDIATQEFISHAPIYLDGESTSFTTPKKFRIPAGLHSLELKLPGYEQEEMVLDGDAGCFQSFGEYINIDAASVEGGSPRVVIRMRKTTP